MLNPSLITDEIAAKLALIAPLAAYMTADAVVRITPYHFRLGQEHRLAEVVYKMPAPSMLVAYEGTQGGNFNGYTIWKHRFGIYYRMANQAGVGSPVGYEDLWQMTVNVNPTGSPVNIRYINLMSGNLDIMDTPSVMHQLDEDQIDRFKATFVFPEIGDSLT